MGFLDFAKESPEAAVMMIIFGGSLVVGAISVIAQTIRQTAMRKEFEQSRREIAAYIAEGSMTPEQGEKLLNAGERVKKKSEL